MTTTITLYTDNLTTSSQGSQAILELSILIAHMEHIRMLNIKMVWQFRVTNGHSLL